jgi:hypothetical protein
MKQYFVSAQYYKAGNLIAMHSGIYTAQEGDTVEDTLRKAKDELHRIREEPFDAVVMVAFTPL